MKSLEHLTEKEFNTLKELGFLYEIYPDAPECFSYIKDIVTLKDASQQREVIKRLVKGDEEATDAFCSCAGNIIN